MQPYETRLNALEYANHIIRTIIKTISVNDKNTLHMMHIRNIVIQDFSDAADKQNCVWIKDIKAKNATYKNISVVKLLK